MDQYITSIALTGKKECIIKMLNAVISNVGLEKAIADGDDLGTINSKLTADDGCGIEIGIPDLLSEEHLTDEVLMQKKAEFGKDCEEDEPYNVCSGRAIEFVRVEDSGDNYIAKFSLYEYEDYNYGDYADWSDIARLYGCKVVIDVVLFMKGRFEEFCATTIFELVEGKVKETRVAPKLDIDEYIYAFKELCKMAPEHYRQLKIQDMEAKVRALQTEISREKLLTRLEHLDETQGHLDVPEGVTYLSGDVLWRYADKLRSIYIPASVDTINKSAISSSSLETIEISPDNPDFCSVNNCILDKDRTRLLIGCKGSVVPDGVTEIENSAFSGCRGLEEIEIPSHVKEIGRDAFSRCTGLTKLTIESGVEKLGWASFMGCTALTCVVLPDSLTDLPAQVFEGCTSLTDVTLPKHLENIVDDAFRNTPFGGGVETTEKVYPDLPF